MLGAGRESQNRQIGQLQEDAQEKWEGSVTDATAGVNAFQMTGVFKKIGTLSSGGVPAGNQQQFIKYQISNEGVTRTADETRPKNINALLFQKVQDSDWRLIPSLPPKF